jgi:hypothetical protein
MKIILFILTLITLAFGCSRNPETTQQSDVHQSYDSIIYKERITHDTVRLPGERFIIRVPVNCPDGKPLPVTINQTHGGASVQASIDSTGYLNITANCDSQYNVIITQDRELKQKQSALDSITNTIIIKEKTPVPKIFKRAVGVAIIETIFIIYKIVQYLKP